MNKLVTLSAGLLLCASVASASGINLAYGDCVANSAPHSATLTCANSTAPFDLITTVELTQPLALFGGAAVIVDFQTAGTSVPSWWRFDGAGCRSGYASAFYNKTSGGVCTAVWQPAIDGGQSTLPIEQWQLGVGGANRLRYNGAAAIGTAINLPAIDPINSINEWGVMRMNVAFTKTTGLGACAGCATGVCVVLNEVKMSYGVGGSQQLVLTGAGVAPNGGEGGQYVAFNTGGPTCPDAVPTHNQTWGSLKSLYR